MNQLGKDRDDFRNTFDCLIRVLMSKYLKKYGELPDIRDVKPLEDEMFRLEIYPLQLWEQVLKLVHDTIGYKGGTYDFREK